MLSDSDFLRRFGFKSSIAEFRISSNLHFIKFLLFFLDCCRLIQFQKESSECTFWKKFMLRLLVTMDYIWIDKLGFTEFWFWISMVDLPSFQFSGSGRTIYYFFHLSIFFLFENTLCYYFFIFITLSNFFFNSSAIYFLVTIVYSWVIQIFIILNYKSTIKLHN